MHEDRSITDPSEFSDEELAAYLIDLLRHTEEIDSSAIDIHIHDGIIHLTGEVPDDMQRDLAQLLVMDIVPEDLIANDLAINPEMDTEPTKRYEEPELEEEPDEVEWDDPEEAAQQGRPYEPPTAPHPEPPHKDGL